MHHFFSRQLFKITKHAQNVKLYGSVLRAGNPLTSPSAIGPAAHGPAAAYLPPAHLPRGRVASKLNPH